MYHLVTELELRIIYACKIATTANTPYQATFTGSAQAKLMSTLALILELFGGTNILVITAMPALEKRSLIRATETALNLLLV